MNAKQLVCLVMSYKMVGIDKKENALAVLKELQKMKDLKVVGGFTIRRAIRLQMNLIHSL